MKRIIFLAVFGALVSCDVPGGYYHSKYDYVDIEDILNHKRMVTHYANCLLNRGPCPPEGTDLKRILPEALETMCLRCTEKQKEVVLKVIRRLRDEYPNLWRQLVDYYDPSESKIKRIEAAIDKLNENDVNFIGNRFAEDSDNDLAAPITEKSTTTKTQPTVRPLSTRLTTSYPTPPVGGPSTTKTSTAKPSTTKEPSKEKSNTPSTIGARGKFTTTTTTPTTSTRIYGWIPQPSITPFDLSFLKIDAGMKLLDLGSRIFQAGTEVAESVINKVQGIFSGKGLAVRIN